MSLNKTLIEWVKNPDGSQGYTWNPITGCLNCTHEGLCRGGMFPCYAYKLANGRLKSRYLANPRIAIPEGGLDKVQLQQALVNDPFYPRFWEDRLDEPLLSVKRKGIFVCDMSDLFGIGIPEQWTQRVLEVVKTDYELNGNDADRFYLLTKQPQNLIKFSPFPDNCWVGVTITEPFPDNTPLVYLAKVEARSKFISFEPLLKWTTGITNQLVISLERAGIGWVIIGSQTKPYKPPKIEWVEEIVEACDKAGIPVFLKNNLRPIIPERQKPFWYIDHYESHLRQELPR